MTIVTLVVCVEASEVRAHRKVGCIHSYILFSQEVFASALLMILYETGWCGVNVVVMVDRKLLVGVLFLY
jgi:hypothetical protein